MTEPDHDAARAAQREAVRRYLFDFRGRFGRRQFWLGAFGLAAALIAVLFAAAALMNPAGTGGGQLVLLAGTAGILLWFYCKLIVHRLQDFGWSGWWFLLLGPILLPLPVWMMHESSDVYRRIEQSHAAQQAIKPYVESMQWGAFLLFFGGFLLMGVLRGTRGPNKYGPDPLDAPPAPGTQAAGS